MLTGENFMLQMCEQKRGKYPQNLSYVNMCVCFFLMWFFGNDMKRKKHAVTRTTNTHRNVIKIMAWKH